MLKQYLWQLRELFGPWIPQVHLLFLMLLFSLLKCFIISVHLLSAGFYLFVSLVYVHVSCVCGLTFTNTSTYSHSHLFSIENKNEMSLKCRSISRTTKWQINGEYGFFPHFFFIWCCVFSFKRKKNIDFCTRFYNYKRSFCIQNSFNLNKTDEL